MLLSSAEGKKMLAALVVLCIVFLIAAALGWWANLLRGRLIVKLLDDKADLAKQIKGYEMKLLHLTIRAHGLGDERVTIEAQKSAVSSDNPWYAEILGPAGTRHGHFREVSVLFRDGTPTAVLEAESRGDPQLNHKYPGVESIHVYWR
jgi:hypothetical protein